MVSAVDASRWYLRIWKRRMGRLGIATVLAVVSVVPFLQGFPLHEYFEVFGKYLIFVALGCLTAFMYSVGMSIWFWWYCRTLEKSGDADLS